MRLLGNLLLLGSLVGQPACAKVDAPGASAELAEAVSKTPPGEPRSGTGNREPTAPVEDEMHAIAASVEELLAALPEQLAGLSDMDALERWCAGARLVPGVADAQRNQGTAKLAIVELAEPVPAARVIELLALGKPRGVSGDVHQRSWSIHLETATLEDPYGPRIATQPPRYGSWEVAAYLDDRPRGPLPEVSAGASPAYDLEKTTATVTHLEIRYRPENGG